MKTLPYQAAFDRIRAEFLEMPEMHLTPDQVERLCGVDAAVCKAVLDDLVRARVLRISANGCYCRLSDTSTARTGLRPAESEKGQRPHAEHRAS